VEEQEQNSDIDANPRKKQRRNKTPTKSIPKKKSTAAKKAAKSSAKKTYKRKSQKPAPEPESSSAESESERESDSEASESEVDRPKNFKKALKKYETHKKEAKIDGSKYITPEFDSVKSVALDKNWFLRVVKTKSDGKYFIDIRKYADKNQFTKGAWVPVNLYHCLVENLVVTSFF